MPWWEHIEPRSRVKVDVDRLTFDFDNPRFTPDKRPTSNTETAVIAHLAATADLGELIQSISASGYVDIEPLIVIGRGEQLVVLEGNRRLAALKVLRNAALAARIRVSLPILNEKKTETLNAVSVYRVQDEDESRDLIGFKHINGPQVWDAYAKALYAASWLKSENQKKQHGQESLDIYDIAHRMGDKHDTINRIVTAAFVLEQAQDSNVYNIDDRARKAFAFSHLYTALTYPEYRDFIGMVLTGKGRDPERNPVPQSHLPQLGQMMRWLYGSKSEKIEPAIKSQNPDLARLKRVIGDPRSRRVMLERQNLDEAIQSTVSSSEKFEKSLVDADQNLKEVQASLDGYDGSDAALLEIAKSVMEKARSVHRSMDAARQEFQTVEITSAK